MEWLRVSEGRGLPGPQQSNILFGDTMVPIRILWYPLGFRGLGFRGLGFGGLGFRGLFGDTMVPNLE